MNGGSAAAGGHLHRALAERRCAKTNGGTSWSKTGIRGKGGQRIQFARAGAAARLPLAACAIARDRRNGQQPQRVVVSFGPEHAPLEQRQVALAWKRRRRSCPSRRSSSSPPSSSIPRRPRTSTRPTGRASRCSRRR